MSNLTRSLMLGGGGSSSGSTYLGPMTWAELQASSYANGSVGLAALDADASVFITDWRVAMVPSADKTYWTTSTPFVLEQGSAATGSDLIYAATGATTSAVASASAGAKTRVTMTAHGLTNTNDGVSVYVSAGSNWAVGLYPYTYVDANNIDLDVAWNASFGNPTIRVATGGSLYTQIRSVVVPAKLLQLNSFVEIRSDWRFTSSTNGRYMFIKHNTADACQVTSSGQSHYPAYHWFRNVNSKASQIGPGTGSNGLFSGQTFRTNVVDTDAANTINFGGDLRVVNEFIRLVGYTITVTI